MNQAQILEFPNSNKETGGYKPKKLFKCSTLFKGSEHSIAVKAHDIYEAQKILDEMSLNATMEEI